jgi:two-component system, OmpR family, phosphate regulon response regulator PhoB
MSKILVVEDEKDIATALTVRLKASGYEVYVAYDALMGITSTVKHKPDLILLDIMLPAGGGIAMAERVNDLPAGIPIIFITASRELGLKERAMALGAAGYLEKPYDAAELVALIKKVLGEGD